jgi:hypothetical protein
MIITNKFTTKNLHNITKHNLFLANYPFKIAYTAWCKAILKLETTCSDIDRQGTVAPPVITHRGYSQYELPGLTGTSNQQTKQYCVRIQSHQKP